MGGLLYKELASREPDLRTLIVAPAALTVQWQRELREKLLVEFDVVEREQLRENGQIWLESPRLITSIPFARQADVAATLANVHGNEAVQKARAQDFDLIFMDIQMPEMDGYQATRALREQGIKTPVIALTAHAMKGDDEKCVEAGCDDYLSKPIDRRRLLEKIQKYLRVRDGAACESTDAIKPREDGTFELSRDRATEESGSNLVSEAGDGEEILNWNELIGRLGDEELIREIVPVFLNDNKERLERLAEAVEAGDAKTLKLYAHAIKGAGRNIGAVRLSNIAHRLECAGREEDLEAANPLLDALRTELEKVVTLLSFDDWIEIAKREKVITNEKLEANITAG